MSEPNNDVTKNPDTTYEPQDLNVRAVAIVAGVLLVAVVVVMVIIAVFFGALGNQQAATGAAPPPIVQMTPPVSAPRLQPNPIDEASGAQNLASLHTHEDAVLHSYGWVDQKAGVVRIPIERAMELVVKEYQSK
jgi:hypothetical protein